MASSGFPSGDFISTPYARHLALVRSMTLEVDSSRRWAGARGEGIDDLGDPAPAVEEVGGGLVVGVR